MQVSTGSLMPNLLCLLHMIVHENQRDFPVDLPQNWTSEVLEDYPQLITELNKGWQERSFARV